MQKRFLPVVLVFLVIPAVTLIVLASFPKKHNGLASPTAEVTDANLLKYKNTLLNKRAASKVGEFTNSMALGTEALPDVRANSALSVDIVTNQIIYHKNATAKLPIASLTKIMTAIVALEHLKLTQELTVSTNAATIGENMMGTTEGEKYTFEELLYGLILHSGNDAAYTIAENAAGNVATFVEWMNFKAEELGLGDTRFYDPSGLDDNTYSTAYDLVKLTKYALQNPDFKKVVATVDKEIAYVKGQHKYLPLSNQTNLLTTYPGVLGVKTGYTEAANLCLVSYAKNNDVEIVSVVLASDARKTDMIQILDASFAQKGVIISHPLLDF